MNINVSVAHLKKKNQNLKAYFKKPTKANNQEKKCKYINIWKNRKFKVDALYNTYHLKALKFKSDKKREKCRSFFWL